MPAPLPLAVREKLVAAYELQGMTLQKTADIFQVGTSTLKRLRRRQRELGSLAPSPKKNGPLSKRTPERMEILTRLIAEHPDGTDQELADAWTQEVGIRMTRIDVQRACSELHLTRKKRR